MMREIFEIDKKGKIVLLNSELPFNQRIFSKILFDGEEDEIPENYIDKPIPEGIRYPQWTGTEWIEGLTQEEIDAINNVSLPKLIENKITLSKILLEEYLKNNPLLFSDDKYYSVTQEKQALLTSAIASYQLKVQAGVPSVLKWNTTGDICREFTLEEITRLVIAITDYVQPLVEKQQIFEIQIKNCITQEEFDNIIIDYEVV